jgi:hypothetical protein
MDLRLTSHARERLRQRVGITSDDAGIAWVKESIKNAKGVEIEDESGLPVFLTENMKIVMDGEKIVTVKPHKKDNPYIKGIAENITKEVSKLVDDYGRKLRKAEIEVAECQLNFLKARNPNTKARISEKLSEAVRKKSEIENEITMIKYAGKRYGVDV